MNNERDTDLIDEDYMVWRVAYDEYFGHDDEAEAETRKLLKRIRATAWDEGLTAAFQYDTALDNWREHITDHIPEPPTNPYRDK